MTTAADSSRELRVAEGDQGQRLDVFLADKLALSRAQARRLLARGAVELDGRPVSEGAKGQMLAVGTRVAVAPFARPGSQRAHPEPEAPLAVLAAGPGWLALDKPAGSPVHPLREEERGSVLGAALARHPEIQGVGEAGLRSGVVHRLDVDTSGVLLLATEEAAWRRLRGAFAEHRVEKVYRALVRGRLEEAGGAELGLVVARHRPARVRVLGRDEQSRGARLCATHWQPLETFADATLVEVRPVTGFLHQVRAVMAWRGFPLLGDASYGDARCAAAAPRHMLHAASVRFEEVAAESPDPPDFAELCQRLRSGAA